LMLAGGVAANSAIRAALSAQAARHGLPLLVPSRALCTDNGAMIAYAGWLLASHGYGHGLDLEAVPRGRLVPDDYKYYGSHQLFKNDFE
ncbi:MAG: hypothetical protein IJS50_05185, partial [Desulfovibrio sp.]|nr:hypothetical protein [Desulfovibrio sp.]